MNMWDGGGAFASFRMTGGHTIKFNSLGFKPQAIEKNTNHKYIPILYTFVKIILYENIVIKTR
jgi:hypothetical protein